MTNNKENLIQQAYITIRDRIFAFDLLPGQSISDFTLSKTMGISRTPLREALAYLKADGLVTASDKGMNVTPISKEDLIDLCYAREAAELMIIQRIIELDNLNETDYNILNSINEKMKQQTAEGNVFLTFAEDEKFHNLLMNKAENTRIQNIHRCYQLQMRRYRYLTLMSDDRTRSTVPEHEDIVEALKRKNLYDTQAAVSSHIHNTMDRYCYALSVINVDEWIHLIKNITTMSGSTFNITSEALE